MGLQEAFQVVEDLDRARIMWDTWGHPEAQVRYPGWMVFAQSIHGDLIVLAEDWGALDGGPWFYDDQQDYVGDKALERGHVYIFEGYYLKYKNGNYRFTGKTRKFDASLLKDWK